MRGAAPGTNSRDRSTEDKCVPAAPNQDSAPGPVGGASRAFDLLDEVGAAWESAQLAAQFAALIGVRCQQEGHGGERCLVRDVAEDGARQSLTLVQELHQVVVGLDQFLDQHQAVAS
jgi:hypothetical protein